MRFSRFFWSIRVKRPCHPCQAALDTDGIVMVCRVSSGTDPIYGCIVIGCQAALDRDLIVIEAFNGWWEDSSRIIHFDSYSDTSVRSVCEPNHIKKHKHIKKRRRRRKTFRHQNFQNVVFWLQKTLKLENKRRRFDVDGGRFLCRHPRCNYLTSWTYKITSILCT